MSVVPVACVMKEMEQMIQVLHLLPFVRKSASQPPLLFSFSKTSVDSISCISSMASGSSTSPPQWYLTRTSRAFSTLPFDTSPLNSCQYFGRRLYHCLRHSHLGDSGTHHVKARLITLGNICNRLTLLQLQSLWMARVPSVVQAATVLPK